MNLAAHCCIFFSRNLFFNLLQLGECHILVKMKNKLLVEFSLLLTWAKTDISLSSQIWCHCFFKLQTGHVSKVIIFSILCGLQHKISNVMNFFQMDQTQLQTHLLLIHPNVMDYLTFFIMSMANCLLFSFHKLPLKLRCSLPLFSL